MPDCSSLLWTESAIECSPVVLPLSGDLVPRSPAGWSSPSVTVMATNLDLDMCWPTLVPWKCVNGSCCQGTQMSPRLRSGQPVGYNCQRGRKTVGLRNEGTLGPGPLKNLSRGGNQPVVCGFHTFREVD